MQIIYAAPFVLLSLLGFLICLLFRRLRPFALNALIAPVSFGFFAIISWMIFALVAARYKLGVMPGAALVLSGIIFYLLPGLLAAWGSVIAARFVLSRSEQIISVQPRKLAIILLTIVVIVGTAISILFWAIHPNDSGRAITVTEAAGAYEYHSGNQGRGRTCFVLRPDGSYLLGDAKEPLGDLSTSRLPALGRWSLAGDPGIQELLIGRSGFPIRRTHLSVRVTIDDDLGMYCDLPLRQH